MAIRRFILGTCLLFSILSACARAQENAELTGVVTDPNGAVVPNASVTLVLPANGETRRTRRTTQAFIPSPNLRSVITLSRLPRKDFRPSAKRTLLSTLPQQLKPT